jgi:hypothetical protein
MGMFVDGFGGIERFVMLHWERDLLRGYLGFCCLGFLMDLVFGSFDLDLVEYKAIRLSIL